MSVYWPILSGIILTVCAKSSFGQEKPNIVFISVDDMDFNEIGAYDGAGQVWTPQMDRLIQDGLKLNQAYVVSPVCVPSRYGLVTGRYPSRCDYNEKHIPAEETLNFENTSWNNAVKTPPYIVEGEQTLAHLMKQADYATGMIGKWHNDYGALQRPIPDMIKGNPRDPEIAAAIRSQYEAFVSQVKRDSGFDVVDRLYYDNKEQFACPPELHTINLPWLTEGALKFIDEHQHEPFFLYFSSPAPHGQFVFDKATGKNGAIGPFIKANAVGDRLLATPAGYMTDVPQSQPSTEDVLKRFYDHVPNGFANAAVMTWLDDSIGAVLGRLDELGLRDNTLVFLISDHQSADKFTIFANGAHVPMGVRWPGKIPAGSVSDSLVSSVDIAATCCDVAGVKLTEKQQLDGVSMVPLFSNQAAVIRDHLLIEFGYARSIVTPEWQYIAMRFPSHLKAPTVSEPLLMTGGNRYIESPTGRRDIAQEILNRHPGASDPDQLYNLKKDPFQKNNLWNSPEYRTEGETMKSCLKKQLQEFSHNFGEFLPIESQVSAQDEVITAHETWCDIQCSSVLKVGEPYTVTITTHGLGEGLYLATVVKALNSQGGTAGIVGVGKRIQNVENEHAYTISVTVKEIPDQFLNVQCGFIVSTTGRWEDRTHTAVVKNIRIER